MEVRIYHGQREEGRVLVGFDIETNGNRWSGGPLVPEKPASFGWGYDIGGAKHLAYILLRDATGSAALASHHHERFAKAVVTHWGSTWRITQDEVLKWIADATPSVAEVIANPNGIVSGFAESKVVLKAAVRIYRGEKLVDEVRVNVQHCPGDSDPVHYPLSLENSLVIRRLNPSGFNWGFRGAAAEQLALAILLDATERIRVGTCNYARFAREFVSTWGDRWEISSMEILAWLAGIGAFLRTPEEVPHD